MCDTHMDMPMEICEIVGDGKSYTEILLFFGINYTKI